MQDQYRSVRFRQQSMGALLFLGLLLWLLALFQTQFWNPAHQLRAVASYIGGPKYARSATEANLHMAIFHLEKSAQSELNELDVEQRLSLPHTWQELIQIAGPHLGPHMKGSLSTAYPLLKRDVDPWGHPWVFRREVLPGGDDALANYELTFGSVGPDGIECPALNVGYREKRQKCDDLLESILILAPRQSD